ncbi:lysosomal Pro-X carboxypeptidase isoform X1 [Octopus sinensis]|uniref:Lysosomal Pro-X carboxypeptidase n=1 Tax=Octopus sinensis TaxID=2607531 RepID=A0A6P7TCM5_9MOLL|nr:lysosomal Pro-X carboxypeptidase isoform X1 [Octopus sinensis]
MACNVLLPLSLLIIYAFILSTHAFLHGLPLRRQLTTSSKYTPYYEPVLSVEYFHTKFETWYFTQPVDHFGRNTDTYQQRYLVSTQWWDGNGGPIFFYTGNEGDIVWFLENSGFMMDIAGEFGAMLVFAEHRYYGKSLPYGTESYKDPVKLSYLTSEQALEDYAKLIQHMKSTIKGAQNSSVVAFGGSYGGMLSAWFRMKYAGVIVGSIAASAPIWGFPGMSKCNGIYTVTTNTFKLGGEHCPGNIRKSWKVIDDLGKYSEGLKFLSEELKLCSSLESSNVDDFKKWLSTTWIYLASVNYPYSANFVEPLPAWPVNKICAPLNDPNLDGKHLVFALAKSLQVYYNTTGNTPCLNFSLINNEADLGWSYQSCTEMIMPSCSDGIADMFYPTKWNFPQFSESCYAQWKVVPRPNWITTEYGGKNIQASSNIVFSNGLLDPYSAFGVHKNISDTLISIIIPEAAHHLDLRSKNIHDPPSVIEARNIEKMHIRKWLKSK